MARYGLVVAGVSILFNTLFAALTYATYRNLQTTVYDRSPVRRVIKAIERGRPSVYSSKIRLSLFIAECAASVALAAYLALGAWRCLDGGTDGWKQMKSLHTSD